MRKKDEEGGHGSIRPATTRLETFLGYFFLAARVRTKVIAAWISSSVILPLKPGMLPFPSDTDWISSASDFFCTSSDRRSATFRLLPTAVPEPSDPWQVTHFDLKTVAPLGAS